MADIITINVGQAGLRIGEQFWLNLERQHQINSGEPCGLMNFFHQTQISYKSRAIFVTQDEREADKLRINSKDLHQSANILSRESNDNSNFAATYYRAYPNIKQEVEECIRRTVEQSDAVGGFKFNSSMDGSAGSGMGLSILQATQQLYPDKLCHSYRLLPDITGIVHPTQIYNSTFSLNKDNENSNLLLFYENAAANHQILKEGKYPTLQRVNKWLGSAITEMTIPLRFAGPLNTSLRKISTNLIIIPRMNFTTFSVSSSGERDHLLSALKSDNFLLKDHFEPKFQHKTLCIYANIGDSSIGDGQIVQTIKQQFQKRNFPSSYWLQNNIHVSISQKVNLEPRSAVVVNSYHMSRVFKGLSKHFSRSYKRRAFVHRYLQSGMDDLEFKEAEGNLMDLLAEYVPRWFDTDQQEVV